MVTIRPACPGDGDELVRLWLDEAAHLVELDPGRFRTPETAGLAARFDEDLAARRVDVAHFVAESETGELLGSVVVRLVEPRADAHHQVLRELSERRAEVPMLGVHSSARRQGIGRRLMAEAEAWAARHGATRLTLDTYAASPVSNPFYRSLGYAAVSIVYERAL